MLWSKKIFCILEITLPWIPSLGKRGRQYIENYQKYMKTFYPDIWDCRYRISAKAIIRDSEGRFLLAWKKMKVHEITESKWDFPWWWIEHWHDVFQTLEKEIQEEMELKVTHIEKNPKYFFVGESACWNIPLALVFYEIKTNHLDFTPSDECQKIWFFTLEEALKENLWPSIRTLLGEAKEKFGEF